MVHPSIAACSPARAIPYLPARDQGSTAPAPYGRTRCDRQDPSRRGGPPGFLRGGYRHHEACPSEARASYPGTASSRCRGLSAAIARSLNVLLKPSYQSPLFPIGFGLAADDPAGFVLSTPNFRGPPGPLLFITCPLTKTLPTICGLNRTPPCRALNLGAFVRVISTNRPVKIHKPLASHGTVPLIVSAGPAFIFCVDGRWFRFRTPSIRRPYRHAAVR